MKIKLHNFRCYEKAEFDFGNDGITLISGHSGAGKSTLLMAIEFALFGSGVKLQTHGKKSCSVELVFVVSNVEYKIYRQKGPNRLVVNDEYEDDAGEAIIKEIFGCNMLACYIPQNIRKSFVLMTPVDRLEFIESFAFNGIDISDIKSRTKSLIKKLGDEHTETIGSLKTSRLSLTQIPKPEKVVFPVKCARESRQKAIENEKVKYRNCEIVINRAKKEIENLRLESSETEMLMKLQESQSLKLNRLEENLEKLKSQTEIVPDYNKLQKLESEYEKMQKNKLQIQLKKEYDSQCVQLDTLKLNELAQMKEDLDNLKAELWLDSSKEETSAQILHMETSIKKLYNKKAIEKMIVPVPSQGEEWVTELDDITKRIELFTIEQKSFTTIYNCPCCSAKLRMNNTILEPIEDEASVTTIDRMKFIKQELPKLDSAKRALKTKVDGYQSQVIHQNDLRLRIENIGIVDLDAESKLKKLQAYQSKNLALEKQISIIEANLQSENFSPTIVSLQKSNTALKARLDKLGTIFENLEFQCDEHELRQKIDTLKTDWSEYKTLMQRQSDLENEITDISKSIKFLNCSHIKKYNSVRTLLDISDDIDDKENTISQTCEKQEKCKSVLDQIEKFKEYEKQMSVYNRFKSTCDELEIKESSLKSQYNSACLFKEKILEAESISISNLIDSVNTHAQFYLDKFFIDNPISVRLVPFKETKDAVKPQINLEIDYKGIEHDIGMLSGGELSRVILAFTLALAEIHDTKFIMLDESTASLDQELTSTVIDGIKENFNGKLVLLIAHQVVQGAFDKIVKL